MQSTYCISDANSCNKCAQLDICTQKQYGVTVSHTCTFITDITFWYFNSGPRPYGSSIDKLLGLNAGTETMFGILAISLTELVWLDTDSRSESELRVDHCCWGRDSICSSLKTVPTWGSITLTDAIRLQSAAVWEEQKFTESLHPDKYWFAVQELSG